MIRTTQKTVVSKKPFYLSAFDQELPAGVYNVEMDEERLEGLSVQAYRRVQCRLHVPASLARVGVSHTLIVAPHEFDLVFGQDGPQSEARKRVNRKTGGY